MKNLTLLLIAPALYVAVWAQPGPAYKPSPAAAQECAPWLREENRPNPQRIEFSAAAPKPFAKKMDLHVPSTVAIYIPQSGATFTVYYEEIGKPWLIRQEQKRANAHHCPPGTYPGAIALIDDSLVIVASDTDTFEPWPGMTALGKYVKKVDVEQFRKGLPIDSGRVGYGSKTPGAHAKALGATIKLEAPCDVTIYRLQSGKLQDFDKTYKAKIETWLDGGPSGTGCSRGGARIGDFVLVAASPASTEELEKVTGDFGLYLVELKEVRLPYANLPTKKPAKRHASVAQDHHLT